MIKYIFQDTLALLKLNRNKVKEIEKPFGRLYRPPFSKFRKKTFPIKKILTNFISLSENGTPVPVDYSATFLREQAPPVYRKIQEERNKLTQPGNTNSAIVIGGESIPEYRKFFDLINGKGSWFYIYQ